MKKKKKKTHVFISIISILKKQKLFKNFREIKKLFAKI